jgi:spermidine/putrescine transport system ATP-binding protein
VSARGSVELVGVTKRFGSETAVADLDLAVAPGEFLSLLGPSGCGKTTTLRMLAGFERPDSGEIRVSGVRVDHVPPHRRDVNTVFQAYALFPHLTVAENVAYGLRQARDRRMGGRMAKTELVARVSEALAMVRMTGYAQRRPGQLSGGQQQRVALARALVNRPSLLLLDEPLAALDRQLREQMQIELKLLQAGLGITFVFVTHDQEEALSMSDRVAVMLGGRLEQLADPFTVYAAPSTAFVAGFIGRQNFFAGHLLGGRDVLRTPDGLVRAATAMSGARIGVGALAAVRPEAVRVEPVGPRAAEAPSGDVPPPNHVHGRVASVFPVGDQVQCVVTTGTTEVLARMPASAAGGLAVGADVVCSWASDRVLLFPADQAALVLRERTGLGGPAPEAHHPAPQQRAARRVADTVPTGAAGSFEESR